MWFRAAAISALCLFALTLPSEAAKRSVHLFGDTYAFNFARDYRFVERAGSPAEKREKVVFARGNLSIVISGSIYDPANTAPLISREAFMAKMATAGVANVKYVNEEVDEGRGGSVMLGSCQGAACLYKMSRALGQKIWLSVTISCEACTPRQSTETGQLADELYAQLKSF